MTLGGVQRNAEKLQENAGKSWEITENCGMHHRIEKIGGKLRMSIFSHLSIESLPQNSGTAPQLHPIQSCSPTTYAKQQWK